MRWFIFTWIINNTLSSLFLPSAHHETPTMIRISCITWLRCNNNIIWLSLHPFLLLSRCRSLSALADSEHASGWHGHNWRWQATCSPHPAVWPILIQFSWWHGFRCGDASAATLGPRASWQVSKSGQFRKFCNIFIEVSYCFCFYFEHQLFWRSSCCNWVHGLSFVCQRSLGY